MHIHGIWGPYAHLSCLVARRYDIPYIVAPRGMLEPWSLNAKKWKKRLAMWMYQRRDLKHAVALHATAESEAEQFRKLGFRQPIIVSPNGVDLPETMPARTTRKDGKKTILFLSRIHQKKGLMELVEAWAKIKGSSLVHCCDSALVGSNCGTGDRGRETKQRQSAAAVGSNQGPRKQTNTLMNSRTNELLDWHVEYAGPDYGGHLHAVQKRIKELGVEDDFTYLGDLGDQEKWSAYRRADVFVLPTYSENFGIVVAEALAAGVPVLTTTGTPWKVLVENQCGWWIEPGVKSLGKVLPEILQMNRETLAEMGNRGRVYAIRAFSWQSIADKMRQAYAWFLEGGNPPPCVRL
jgi:glycosyltransferase involved in cell wall biosynthesis